MYQPESNLVKNPGMNPAEFHQPLDNTYQTRNNSMADLQGNKSKISNNPLVMDINPTDTRKKEKVLGLVQTHDSMGIERQQYFRENRDAYKNIKQKNGNNGGVKYNILSGM